MENEENRGIIVKNASKDQLEIFFSHYSLSHTLGHLDYSFSTLGECGILGDLEQEGKDQVGKGGIRHRQRDSLQVLIFMYDFLARFGMHDIACGSLLSWNGFFQV